MKQFGLGFQFPGGTEYWIGGIRGLDGDDPKSFLAKYRAYPTLLLENDNGCTSVPEKWLEEAIVTCWEDG